MLAVILSAAKNLPYRRRGRSFVAALLRMTCWTLVFLLAACGAPQAAPASSGPAKIKLAYSSISYAQIALPVAKETGIFEKNGLDADFVFGPNGIPAMLSGEVQGSVGSTEELILADVGGADLTTIATMVPLLQHKLMVRPEIKTVADLKGRPVGITKRGTITETVLRMSAKRGGLDPDKDLQMLELGTADKQLAALTAGSVFAGSFSPPNTDVAEAQGAHVLYDYPKEHIEYPVAQVIVPRQWAAKNQPLALALLRSLAQAVALSRTQPDVVAGVYAKWAKTGDDAAKIAIKLAQEQVPVRMLPTVSGMRAVLETVAQTQPAAGSSDPVKFFDDSYIKKLEQEGFYSTLPQ
jgi:NitT/TauT family transport system substrate-binding protein